MLFNELQGNPNSEMKETGIKWLRDTHSNKNYFCPEGLWSLLLWRYSRPVWTRSCAACCRWPCFGRRVGLDDPQTSLPTPAILWFCDLATSAEAPTNPCKELFKLTVPCSLLVSQDPHPELKIQANNAQERGNWEVNCARPKSIKPHSSSTQLPGFHAETQS